MNDKIKIALIGKSGSGKTEAAKYLASKYHFAICNTGKKCRELAKEFFNSESKEILQKITDSFNAIEMGIWLKVAMKDKSLFNKDVVIDSIRFIEDYNFAKSHGFKIWKIEAPQAIRMTRLRSRGQEFKIENDNHQSETELQNIPPDFIINNAFEDVSELFSLIDKQFTNV